MQRALSYVFIAGGVFLGFQGLRDLVQWQWGQYDAGTQFEEAPPAPRAGLALAGIARTAPRLQPGETVAKLSIPRLNTELYVVEGTDAADLRRGPGHMTGTAMPGEPGNCVIAGHRDTHFRVLRNIRVGDSVILESHGGRFVYRVSRAQVVSPKNTGALQPTPRTLHLITCYPFYYVGSAPKRFVVEARLASQ